MAPHAPHPCAAALALQQYFWQLPVEHCASKLHSAPGIAIVVVVVTAGVTVAVDVDVDVDVKVARLAAKEGRTKQAAKSNAPMEWRIEERIMVVSQV